jgi:hypothetical protein
MNAHVACCLLLSSFLILLSNFVVFFFSLILCRVGLCVGQASTTIG